MWYFLIPPKPFSFQNTQIKLNLMTWIALKSSAVIFQALEPLQPQWPQQPQIEKVLKSNLILHDSTKDFFPQKHRNKAEFYNLDDSEVLSSDFQALEYLWPQWPQQPQQPQWPQWPQQPHFKKEITEFYVSINHGTKITYPGLSMWNGSSKTHYFIEFWHPFSWRLLGPSHETKIKFKE